MEDSEQDKTEQASQFKLRKAREKGSVARGLDLGPAVVLAGLIGYLFINGEPFLISLSEAVRMAIITAPQLGDGNSALTKVMGQTFLGIGRHLMYLTALIWGMALFFDFLQTGSVFSIKPIIPDFNRINPAQGIKRIFSMRALIETVKSSFKLVIYSAIGWILLRDALDESLVTVVDSQRLAQLLAHTMLKLLFGLCAAAIFFAVVDQLVIRRQFRKQMRMSRREVKREHKDQEGDPRVKGRRKKLHENFFRITNSLREIRNADVIIVNPEHFAIALQYNNKTMIAPKIIACGAGWLALTIKRIALYFNVTIVEDAILARRLYYKSNINCEVDADFYKPIANIYKKYKIVK